MLANDLLYRRQYLFITQEVDVPDKWNKTTIQHKEQIWNLYSHPDLFVLKGKNDFFELILLGYILDPLNPGFDDNAVFNDILRCSSFQEVLLKINVYNGRYVLIYKSQDIFRILNDATGFREVYYYLGNNVYALGSTPNIISRFLDIPITKNKALIDFINSNEFKNTDCTMIGNNTLYEGIYNLSPNHYLDVVNKKAERFWPSHPLTKITVEECAEICAKIFKGTIESALNRFTLHVGITAGWDTRLLLSATKEYKDKIFYYTNKRSFNLTESRDITIPRRIANKLNFKLNYIDISEEVDDEFKNIFKANNILAHEKLLPVFYEVYKRGWQNIYTVSGSLGNSVSRIYLRLPKNYEANGINIARLMGYEKHQYITDIIDKWVLGVKDICQNNNIDIMDLFELEQDDAHWSVLGSSEQDIVRDEIRILNNRFLYESFWSLDDKYRFQYYPVIYVKIMEKLWKEVLEIPINPSFKNTIYRILRAFGLDIFVYKYFKRLAFKRSIRQSK